MTWWQALAAGVVAGVLVGVALAREFALWRRARRRGGTIDLVGVADPDDWFAS